MTAACTLRAVFDLQTMLALSPLSETFGRSLVYAFSVVLTSSEPTQIIRESDRASAVIA